MQTEAEEGVPTPTARAWAATLAMLPKEQIVYTYVVRSRGPAEASRSGEWERKGQEA